MTDDTKPTVSWEGRSSPDEALRFMIAQAFADPRTPYPGGGYIAYFSGGDEIAVLDVETDKVTHYRVTIEERDA